MKRSLSTATLLLALAGCTASYDPYVAAIDNQLASRSYQTRDMQSTEYTRLVTAVISTLQDHHFRIVDLDPGLGTITAYQMTRLQPFGRGGGRTDLTVLIREKDESNYRVRMNMSTGPKPDDEPELYQQFFAALHRKLHDQQSGK